MHEKSSPLALPPEMDSIFALSIAYQSSPFFISTARVGRECRWATCSVTGSNPALCKASGNLAGEAVAMYPLGGLFSPAVLMMCVRNRNKEDACDSDGRKKPEQRELANNKECIMTVLILETSYFLLICLLTKPNTQTDIFSLCK